VAAGRTFAWPYIVGAADEGAAVIYGGSGNCMVKDGFAGDNEPRVAQSAGRASRQSVATAIYIFRMGSLCSLTGIPSSMPILNVWGIHHIEYGNSPYSICQLPYAALVQNPCLWGAANWAVARSWEGRLLRWGCVQENEAIDRASRSCRQETNITDHKHTQ
jgi:hypothetical protein